MKIWKGKGNRLYYDELIELMLLVSKVAMRGEIPWDVVRAQIVVMSMEDLASVLAQSGEVGREDGRRDQEILVHGRVPRLSSPGSQSPRRRARAGPAAAWRKARGREGW